MRLGHLTLKNVGSFKHPQTLEFPQEPGLYFMHGCNLVDPKLGGNGSGKSTIWNALHWLAFGRYPDGRAAGDVANWDMGKGAEVELVYSHPGEDPVAVKRTWAPITWTMAFLDGPPPNAGVDLTKSTANPFLADLGVTQPVFQQCVLMAQGGDMFLDLKADAQAELFGTVLGLDRWLDYSAKAAKLAKSADDECRRLEAELARVEGKMEAQQDYGADIHKWEQQRRTQIAALEHDFNLFNDDLQQLLRQRTELKPKVAEWEERVADRRQKRQVLAQRLDAGEQLIRDHEDDLRRLEPQLRHELARAQLFEQDGKCPTCGLNVAGHKDAHRIIDELEATATKLNKRATGLKELIEGFTAGQRELKREWEDADEALEQSERELERLVRQQATVQAEIDRANRRLDDVEEQVKRLENEENPFKGRQEEALERARSAQARLLEVRQGLDKAQGRFALYSLWIRGFKDLRLQQISEALAELEVEVNSSLAELGLDGWELRFDVDRETKGGSVQRGFAVTVRSPANDKPVSWKSWSGGEKQRLRLAGNMGLANLIRARTGAVIPLEVWDEPTKGLSPEGVASLLACLERRARVEQRQIWIIDHTSHSFGGFAGSALVVKDGKGSRIEQS